MADSDIKVYSEGELNRLLDDDSNLNPVHLADRFSGLLMTRHLWEPQWQEIANLMLPRKNDIIIKKQPGARREERLYESTAIFAAELLAASLHGTLTSSYNPWFSLILNDPDLADDAEVGEWLEECGEDLRLAFNRSNFATESHEGYLDLVCFGTMPLLFEDRRDEDMPGEFRFSEIPLQNVAIAENGMGVVNTVFRSLPLSREAIRERWPDTTKNIAELGGADGKPTRNVDNLIEVLHAVVPSKWARHPTLLNPGWASVYFLAKAKVILEAATGFHECPYLVCRWTKQSGETYGRGRGHTALPDVKSINKLVELELRALGKSVDPPLAAQGGDVIGKVRIERGGVTTTRNEPGKTISPLLPQVNFAPVNLKTVALQDAIKKMFYSDQLQMPQGPQMTATEVNVRYELMQRILGPTLGRLESELLAPLVHRAYMIRKRAGCLPDPPMKVIQGHQKKSARTIMQINYQGPLARAQHASDVGATQQLIQVAEPMLQVMPNILDNVDMDGLFAHTAAILGVPRKYIRDEDQVSEIRDQRNQQAQQQQDQQNQNESMAAAGKAAPMVAALHKAPEKGSVAAGMTGQQGDQGGPTDQSGAGTPPQGQ